MKNLLIVNLLVLTSAFAYADSGSITCNSAKPVNLEFEEMSDISKATLRLSLNDQEEKIDTVEVSQTQYGVLAISISAGTTKSSSSYKFENLGSSDCFGVYESKQSGPAKIEILSADGKLEEAECTCTVD